MPRYVCAGCECLMTHERSGLLVEERTDEDGPYKIWSADLWRCPHCGTELLTGFGAEPVHQHFEEGYEKAECYLVIRDRTPTGEDDA